MIRLDIFADPICPWCLIGKAELDRALESRPNHPFVVEWHPFQLNPGMQVEGMSHVDYMKKKFTNEAGILKAMKPVLEASERLGLWINMSLIQVVPNTADAHRLIHWAAIEGRQAAVMSGLMRAYWREGGDIGDHNTLAEIGAKSGMDGDMIHRLLKTDADQDLIREKELHARERGITSVPTFIIADQHVVQGAQQADFWRNVIDELAETA